MDPGPKHRPLVAGTTWGQLAGGSSSSLGCPLPSEAMQGTRCPARGCPHCAACPRGSGSRPRALMPGVQPGAPRGLLPTQRGLGPWGHTQQGSPALLLRMPRWGEAAGWPWAHEDQASVGLPGSPRLWVSCGVLLCAPRMSPSWAQLGSRRPLPPGLRPAGQSPPGHCRMRAGGQTRQLLLRTWHPA